MLLWRQLEAEMRRVAGACLLASGVLALLATATAHVTRSLLPGATMSALLPTGTRVYADANYAYVLEVVWTLAAVLPALVLSGDVADHVRAVTLAFPIGTGRLILLRAAVGLAWPLAWTAGGLGLADALGMPFVFTRDLALLLPESAAMFALALAAVEASGQVGVGAGAAVGAMVFGAGLPGDPLPQPSDYWELFCARGHPLGPLLWDNRLALAAISVLLLVAAAWACAYRRGHGAYAP